MKSFKKHYGRNYHHRRNHSGIYNKEQYIFKRTKMRCEACGEKFPRELLEFHHPLDMEKKIELTAKNFRGIKGVPKKISEEADQCFILCSNCHRLEHLALKRGETIINDKETYFRYRNHRIPRNENLDDWYSRLYLRDT
tara:strand:- start:9922 stop:10338 length:417 start_codon:yes stop_codon:yes gene_type:complete